MSFLFLAIIVSILAYRSIHKIEEGHRAVVLRFGEPLPETLRPGIHLHLPWEKVVVYSIMEKSIELMPKSEPSQAYLADGTTIQIYASIRYRLLESQSHHFLFEIDNLEEHLRDLFSCILRNKIAQFKDFSELRKNREQLTDKVKTFLSRKVEGCYGIEFISMDLRELIPPPELIDALNSFQKANAEVETEYSHVLAECQQRVEAANHSVSISSKRAKAVELDILTMKTAIEELSVKKTLSAYLQRRRDEVNAQSKTIFSNQ